MQQRVDVAIIGGGIAGLALAAALEGRATSVLVEAEQQVAYHTSSRSAQQMQPTYGPVEIRALTRATLGMMPAIEAAVGQRIIKERSLIWAAVAGDEQGFEDLLRTVPGTRRGTLVEAHRRLPVLRQGAVAEVAFDDQAKEVDVGRLLGHLQSEAEHYAVKLLLGTPVRQAYRTASGWRLRCGDQEVHAGTVINAAGAWADQVAVTHGLLPLGLTPRRRTVTVARAGVRVDPMWPMVLDVAGRFYFRAEDICILASPMEDAASHPHDARPADSDVALIKKRVNALTTLALGESTRSWTGLRTISHDGLPVVGRDPSDPAFYWLAGQGGYGIQTSAALGRLAAADLLGADLPFDADSQEAFARLNPSRPSLQRIRI